jgi:hypothetical protein
MDIHDRDYMRDKRHSSPRSILSFLGYFFLGFVFLFLFLFCLRLPAPLYIKLPLMIGLGFFGRLLYRWCTTDAPPKISEGNQAQLGLKAERRGDAAGAASHYEQALKQNPEDVALRVRLLSAYHASAQSVNALRLIATLDGQSIPDKHVEELEYLILQYQQVSFTQVDAIYRVQLGE